MGFALNLQKVFPPLQATAQDELLRILLASKTDQLFRATINNPASLQRLVLVEAASR